MHKPDWKKREALIRAWFEGTGSLRVEQYWRRFERHAKWIQRIRSSDGYRKSAEHTVIRAVSTCPTGLQFTSKNLMMILKKVDGGVKWSPSKIGKIIARNDRFLGVRRLGFRNDRVLWEKMPSDWSGHASR